MIKKYLFLLAFLISIIVLPIKIIAWWSATMNVGGTTTHYKVTKKAIEQIKNTEKEEDKCPDVVRFGDRIIEWTTWPGNDENAHGKKYRDNAGVYNGGPYQRWWSNPSDSEFKNDGVLVQYKLCNFANGVYSAYYYLAMMCHLIADQAVPAHAANIKHGFDVEKIILKQDVGDNLEGEADDRDPENGGTIELNEISHYYYFKDNGTNPPTFYGLIRRTQDNLTRSSWEHPTERRQYWYENQNANTDYNYKYKGEAFYDTWGYYGGVDRQDIYTRSVDFTGAIIQSQFQDAVAFMDGFLRLVSKKLPPIVSNLQLVDETIPGVIDTTITNTNGVKIKFTVDENRMPDILIKITVNGKAIKDAETGFIWDGGALTKNSLDPNYLSDQLPYKKTYGINWNGLLSDETYPTDGRHDLVVMAQDSDGNWSDESTISFTIQRNSPAKIEIIQPKEGSLINKNQPTFEAKIIGNGNGGDLSSVKIEVDGIGHPIKYDFITGNISYTAETKLAEGGHSWKVTGEGIEDTIHTFTIDTTRPSPLKSLTAAQKDRAIELNWIYPDDNSAVGVEIYRSTTLLENTDYEYLSKHAAKIYDTRQFFTSKSNSQNEDLLRQAFYNQQEEYKKDNENRRRMRGDPEQIKNRVQTMDELLELMQSKDVTERGTTILATVFLTNEVPKSLLLNILKNDENEYCREISARILGLKFKGDSTIMSQLKEALKDDSGVVRQAAVDALTISGDKTNADIALKGLIEGKLIEKISAVEALARIGDKSLIPVLKNYWLDNDDVWRRYYIKIAIDKLNAVK